MPLAAQASNHFDATAATNAWLATVPAAAKARSNAYFEGGYWLVLWDFLYSAALFVVLLETRWSARLRDLVERRLHSRFWQAAVYTLLLILLCSLASFPLTAYEGFFREHQYGLSNQGFAAWLGDQLVALLLASLVGSLLGALFLSLVRKRPTSWPLWAIAGSEVFIVIGIVITPVWIAPLFNTYKPLANAAVKNQILSLARANGIPATDVYEVDASRQSKRVSANVSGLFGSERITLNDNLLKRCSPQAIASVMGHEMGHYVLHHLYHSVLFAGVCAALAIALLRWSLTYALARWGARWGLRGAADPAALPLVMLILSAIGFLAIPLTNTYTRVQEYEADIFGLDAARQPDGEAEVDLLLGEYRKLEPAPLEEFVFSDHPSGRTRIFAAMRWKAQNLCLFDAHLKCAQQPLSAAAVPSGR